MPPGRENLFVRITRQGSVLYTKKSDDDIQVEAAAPVFTLIVEIVNIFPHGQDPLFWSRS